MPTYVKGLNKRAAGCCFNLVKGHSFVELTLSDRDTNESLMVELSPEAAVALGAALLEDGQRIGGTLGQTVAEPSAFPVDPEEGELDEELFGPDTYTSDFHG